MRLKTKVLPIAAGILMSVFFGFSFMFTREALGFIDTIHFLSLRFLTASLTVNILFFLKIIRLDFKNKKIGPLLLLALFQPIIYFLAETYGISLTSASEGGMVVALIPICTVLMATTFLKEKPPLLQIFSIITSVTGVLIIVIMQASAGLSSNLIGLFILLGAPIAGGAFTVLSRHISPTFSPWEKTYVMMNVGAVFFVSFGFFRLLARGQLASFFQPLQIPQVSIALIYLALFSSVLAFFLVNYALKHLQASQTAAFPSLTTLIAISSGAFILGEQLFWYHFIGGFLIALGVWGTNYFAHHKSTKILKPSV